MPLRMHYTWGSTDISYSGELKNILSVFSNIYIWLQSSSERPTKISDLIRNRVKNKTEGDKSKKEKR